MDPTIPTIAAVVTSVATAGVKIIPGVKDAPWHNAALRLFAVVIAIAVVLGAHRAQGTLGAFAWHDAWSLLGEALLAFLGATGLFVLTPKKEKP